MSVSSSASLSGGGVPSNKCTPIDAGDAKPSNTCNNNICDENTITKAAQYIFQFSSPLVIFFVRNPEIAVDGAGTLDVEHTSPPEVDRVMKRMERELNEVDASHLVGSGVPGASVSLSFAKASTLYHHGAAALHVFLLLIPSKKASSSSRIRRAAELAKAWRDELIRTGAAETTCIVFLLHQDLVDAGASPNPIDSTTGAAATGGADSTTGSSSSNPLRSAATSLFSRFGHQKTHVEEALDAVQEYMEEFRKRIPSPMNINIYQPSSYKDKLLDALKNSYQEHALQLKALRHQCHTARSAPGWCIQEFWRKGYDLAMHHLRYGAIHEAISCFTSMFTEYYNHSDDFGFVVDWSFLRDVGQTRNVLDPLRSTTSDASRGGYPSSFADAAEVIDGLMFVVGAEMTCSLFLGNREGALARFASLLEVVKEKLSDINREESSLGTSARHSAVSSYDSAASPQAGLRVTPLAAPAASASDGGPAVFRFDPCMRRVAPPLYLQHFFLFRCCMSALDLCTGSNLAARVGSLVQRNTHGHFTLVDGNTVDASQLVAGLSGCPTPSATPQKVRPDAAASLSSPAALMGSTATAIFDGGDDSTSSFGGAFAYSIGSIDDAALAGGAGDGAGLIGAMCQKEYMRYCVVVGDLCLEARNHLVELAGLCGFQHPVSSALSASVGVPPSANTSSSPDGGAGGDADPTVEHHRTSSGALHYRTASPSTSAAQSTELRKWLGLECFATVSHFHATFLSITRVAASAFRKGQRIKQSHALLCHEAAVLLSIDPYNAVDLLHRMVVPYYRSCGWRSLLLHAEELYVQSVRWLRFRHKHHPRRGSASSSTTADPMHTIDGVPLVWHHAAQQYALDLAIEHRDTSETQLRWCRVFAELHEAQAPGDPLVVQQQQQAMCPALPLSQVLHGSHPLGASASRYDADLSSMQNSYSARQGDDGRLGGRVVNCSSNKSAAPFVAALQSLVTDTISISCVKRMTPERIVSTLHKSADEQRKGLSRRVSSGFLSRWRSGHTHRPSIAQTTTPSDAGVMREGAANTAHRHEPSPLPRPRWILHHHHSPTDRSGLPNAPHALIDEPVVLVAMVASSMDLTQLGVATSATLVLHSKKRWLAADEPVHIVELHSTPLQYDAVLRAIVLVVPFTPCHAGTYKVACITVSLGQLVLTHNYNTPSGSSLLPAVSVGSAIGGDGAAGNVSQRASVVLIPSDAASTPPLPADHGSRLTLLVVPEPDAGIQLSVDVPPVHHCFGDITTTLRVGVRVTEPLKPPPPPSATATTAVTEGEDGATANAVGGGDGVPQHVTRACYFEGLGGMQASSADGGGTTSHHGTGAHLRGLRSERTDAGAAALSSDRQTQEEAIAHIRIGRPPRRPRGRTFRPSIRGGTSLRPRTPSGEGGVASSLSPHRHEEAAFSGCCDSFARTVGGGGASLSDYPLDQQIPSGTAILLDGTTQLFATRSSGQEEPSALFSTVGGGSHVATGHALLNALSEPVRSCLPDWAPLERVTLFQHTVALDNTTSTPSSSSVPQGAALSSGGTAALSGSPPDVAGPHRTPLRGGESALDSCTPPSSGGLDSGALQPPPLLYHRGVAVTMVANEYIAKLASCNTAKTNLQGATLDVLGSALEPSGYTTLSLHVPRREAAEASGQGTNEGDATSEAAAERLDDQNLNASYRDAVLKASLITIDVPLLPIFMKGDATPLSFSCHRNREVSVRHTKLTAPFAPAIAVAYAFAPFQERMFVTVSVRNVLATCALWLRHAVLQVLIAEPGETMAAFAVKSSAASNARLFHQPLHPGDTVAFLFELSLQDSYRCQQVAVRHGTRLCVAYSPWELYDKEGVYPLPKPLPSQQTPPAEGTLDDVARVRYHSLESLKQLHDATSCNIIFCAADHFTSKHLCAFNVMVLIEGMDELGDGSDDDEAEEDPAAEHGATGLLPADAGASALLTASATDWSAPSTPLPNPLVSNPSWTRRSGAASACGARHGLHATTTTVGDCGDPSGSATRLHEAGDPVHFRAIVHPQAQNWPRQCQPDKDQFLVSIDVSASDWLVLGRQRHVRVLSRDAEQHIAFSATPIGRGSNVPLPSLSIRHVCFDATTGTSSVGAKVAVDVAKCRAFLRLKRSRGATVLHHVEPIDAMVGGSAPPVHA